MSVRNRTEAQRQRRIHTDKLERQNERHQTGGEREGAKLKLCALAHLDWLGVCVCTVPYHHSVHMSLFVFI